MSDEAFGRTDTTAPALADEAAATDRPADRRPPVSRRLRSVASWGFVRHLAEMVLAMLVAMAVRLALRWEHHPQGNNR